jgi:colanic acid/amylovoran biosynthesis glycosyltransferase
MNKSDIKVCVTLPSQLGYSETFLQAHVDNLSTAVNYLQDFPIDIEDVFPDQSHASWTEQLVHIVRIWWHRYFVNLIKQIRVRNFLRKKDIDLILAEYGMTAIGAVAVCKKLNIPLVVHFHGYDAYLTELLNRHKRAYRRVFDCASAIIAVSKHMRQQLITLGAPAEKIFYNPYGVDIDKFRQAPVATSSPVIISVGRFVEKKAPYLTILAFKKVLQKLPEAKLVMVGTGPLHDICAKLIEALQIGYAVELTGALGHDQVAALMQQSRVFVQHSLLPASGDSEGTPVAILEAGAAGLPVISTRHAGISDVVLHGKTGFLVDEGDINGMSEYLQRILRDPQLAMEMGQNAREYIIKTFNMERSIGELRKVFEICLNQQRGTRKQSLDQTATLTTPDYHTSN